MSTEQSTPLGQLTNEIGFDFCFHEDVSSPTNLNKTYNADKGKILEKNPYAFKGAGNLGLIEIVQLTYQHFQEVNLSSFYDAQKARRDELKKQETNTSKNDCRPQKTTRYLDLFHNRHAYFYFNSNVKIDSREIEDTNDYGHVAISKDDEKKSISIPVGESTATSEKDCSAIDNDDNTGNRVYLGAVLINLLLSYFPSLVKGKTVAEIGCGVGLTGVALCRLGCSKIVLTDAQWNCLALAKYNINQELSMQKSKKTKENAQSHVSHCSNQFPEVVINQLRWGDDVMIETILQENLVEYDGFDVLLGGDLLYYNVNVQLLFGTIKKLLIPSKNEKKSKPFIIILAHLERCIGAARNFCDLCRESDILVKELNIEHLIQNKDDEIIASSWRNGQLLLCGNNLISSLPEDLLMLCKGVATSKEEEGESEGDMFQNMSAAW